MQPIIPCTRCGYATAPAFPRCWCCGRPRHECRRRRRRQWHLDISWPFHRHRPPPSPKEDLAELLAAW